MDERVAGRVGRDFDGDVEVSHRNLELEPIDNQIAYLYLIIVILAFHPVAAALDALLVLMGL